MCNAHNHRVGCQCGWGGIGHSGRGGVRTTQATLATWRPRSTWDGSLRDDGPNAICPRCQERVFFVRPANGGSIWLDEMGPPWPKHPCMNEETIRLRFPTPLIAPLAPAAAPWRPGWAVHTDDFGAKEDATWSCFAVLVAGSQLATAVTPPAPLSPIFLSWAGGDRLYGEVQYLARVGESVETVVLGACSYGMMRRARESAGRRLAELDWLMLEWWIEADSAVKIRRPSRLDGVLRGAIESLVTPGWSRNEESRDRVRRASREVIDRYSFVDPEKVYKWIRLFLS